LVVVFLILGLFLYIKVRMSIGSNLLGPVGVASQQITKRRYEQGKVIRIFFKNGVTDDQVLSFGNEWKHIAGVNGFSFTSQKISGQPVIDLFIVDSEKKEEIMQNLKQNNKVDKVIDVIEK